MSDFLKVGYLAPLSPSRPPALISNSSSRISRVRDATRTAPIHRAETRSATGDRPREPHQTQRANKKFPKTSHAKHPQPKETAHTGDQTADETASVPRNPTERW
ncbi:hypothetical protein HPB50_019102 [Hyalomma asiaticum]|uniref:Uncharacterized protein n=1 Tax=Hyalomma asiaticum TaxID=266040 RepID=A0ACB7SNK1_HYAAI|nr:hypothetical protein HPB50_019102 [Hyalomma asiaticum]